jgi:ribosomal protein L6P/L9E
MSRIGKLPIAIPSTVKVTVVRESVSVSGAAGMVSQSFGDAIESKFNGSVIGVFPKNDSRYG